jgi:rhodanese-related sulfurtransferase
MRIFLLGLVLSAGFLSASSLAGDAPDDIGLPEVKRTSLGLYVTAQEAYEHWRGAPGKVKLLDVRTPEEFIYTGHAEMAWNIPFSLQTYQWDAKKGRFAYEPNPDFVKRVKEWAQPGDTLMVMCRSGGRSARAVDLLAQAGFTNVYTITDGVEGDKVEDPASAYHGKRMVNGWKNSGLPWTYQLDPQRMLLPTDRGKPGSE